MTHIVFGQNELSFFFHLKQQEIVLYKRNNDVRGMVKRGRGGS